MKINNNPHLLLLAENQLFVNAPLQLKPHADVCGSKSHTHQRASHSSFFSSFFNCAHVLQFYFPVEILQQTRNFSSRGPPHVKLYLLPPLTLSKSEGSDCASHGDCSAGVFHLTCVCALTCVCVRARVRLNGDMFVFIDSERRIVAAHTQQCTGGRGPGLGKTCVFKVHTGLIMLI